MKKFLKVIGIVLIFLLAGAAIVWFFFLKPTPPSISDEDRAILRVMPLPSELEFGTGTFAITEKFGVTFEQEPNPKIVKAIDRFYKQLELKTKLSFTERSGAGLQIQHQTNDNEFPQLEDDESYELTINGTKISLNASSTTGIL